MAHRPVEAQRLGPELIAVPRSSGNINAPTPERPEAPSAGLVLQVSLAVSCADADALPRRSDDVATIAWAVAVNAARGERLDPLDIGSPHAGQLGDLYAPNARHLHLSIFAA